MSFAGFLRRHWSTVVEARWKSRARAASCPEIQRTDWPNSLRDPLTFYRRCFDYFHSRLPPPFREHRAYFHNVPSDRRGFGEDAFHTMWCLLLQEFRPANFLEIGVFRGQVISLVGLWAKLSDHACAVHGISPFTPAGDSVSTYRQDIDYYQDTLSHFEHFQLPPPRLLRAFSTDPEAIRLIESVSWDMTYIDGNHDFDVVSKDWSVCSRAIKPFGLVVLDDAGLSTSYHPPVFASRGHPGPSRLAQRIDRTQFTEVLQVGHNRVFQRVR